MKTAFRLAAVVLALTALPQFAIADWTQDGNAISTAIELQMNPVIISDGGTGAFIAWQDRRAGDLDIYVQKVDALGNVLWTADGVVVCAEGADQSDARLVTDGAGGIIVVWEDARTTTEFDIYAQRLDADGLPLWETNGIVVSIGALNQHNPSIAPDGSGGAFVVWQDHRNGQPDIYAHHLAADGPDTLWTADGVPVCSATRPQQAPHIVASGGGGAIACWLDRRGGLGDIYAQKLNLDGSVVWATNGVAMCADPEDQAAPAIVDDRFSGAFVAWADNRNGNWDIYANHVDNAGDLLAVNGVAICTALGDQNRPVAVSASYPALAASGIEPGFAIIAWDDKRADAGDIYARDLGADGGFAWTPDGVPVCTAPLAQMKPTATIDGANGAVVAWQDRRANFHENIYAQRVDAVGSPLWPADGVLLCGATGDQYNPVVAVSDEGAAIVAWEDLRSGSYDVYAQYAVGPTTTVAIASFEATSGRDGVRLRAAFRSNAVIEGVNVYRGDAHGAFKKIAGTADSGAEEFEYVDRDVQPGATYRYQIGVVDADGEFFSPIATVSVAALTAALDQNRPNPFNPTTTIRFVVPDREHVSLIVYDASGRVVRTLLDETADAGARDVVWDGRDDRGVALSSGVYFYRLSTGKRVESKKMVLLK